PANGAVGLNVLDPAIGRVRDVDPAGHCPVVAGVRPALDSEVLNPSPPGGRRGSWRHLGKVWAARRKVPVKGRAQGQRATGTVDGLDFDALAGRSAADPFEVAAIALLDGAVVDHVHQRESTGQEVRGG